MVPLGLNHIAKQANWLEGNGNIKGSDHLRALLESHNCCLLCGTKQIFDSDYYRKTGMWKCPSCNDF